MNELRLKQIISEELTKTDQNKIGVMIRKEIRDAFGNDLEKKVLKILEKELKNGFEQTLPLEEIGRRAILIRNENALRVKIKNAIAEALGCEVKEIKQDHLSG